MDGFDLDDGVVPDAAPRFVGFTPEALHTLGHADRDEPCPDELERWADDGGPAPAEEV